VRPLWGGDGLGASDTVWTVTDKKGLWECGWERFFYPARSKSL
jgi:hypothetical protein